jgi:hypothetical protein
MEEKTEKKKRKEEKKTGKKERGKEPLSLRNVPVRSDEIPGLVATRSSRADAIERVHEVLRATGITLQNVVQRANGEKVGHFINLRT